MSIVEPGIGRDNDVAQHDAREMHLAQVFFVDLHQREIDERIDRVALSPLRWSPELF